MPKKSATSKGVKDPQFSFSQYVTRYIQAHIDALGVSFRILSQAPLATLLTVLALGVCLALPFGLYLTSKNVNLLTQGWQKGSAITVYADPKATPAQIERITSAAKTYPFVKNIDFLSSDNALKEFQQVSGMDDVLALLPENPLPHVISIQLETVNVNPSDLVQMKEAMSKLPKVNLASFDHEWVEKLQRFLDFGNMLTQILYAIVGFGVLLVIGNTIRLSLERHRDELEVLRVMGATQAFIRRPFLYRGLLFGLFGGTIALLIMTGALALLKTPTQQLVAMYSGAFRLESLPFMDTIKVLFLSAMLGWVGALVAFMQQRSALKYDSP